MKNERLTARSSRLTQTKNQKPPGTKIEIVEGQGPDHDRLGVFPPPARARTRGARSWPYAAILEEPPGERPPSPGRVGLEVQIGEAGEVLRFAGDAPRRGSRGRLRAFLLCLAGLESRLSGQEVFS